MSERTKLEISLDAVPEQVRVLTKIADEGGQISQLDAGQIALTLTRLAAALRLASTCYFSARGGQTDE